MRRLLIIVMALLSLPVVAQEEGATAQVAQTVQPLALIGYLSHDAALKAMPGYADVQRQTQELRQRYEAEMKRVEDEFNQKYEAFLEGRKDFPRTILLKRQTELQELLERNVAFKNQSRDELRQAEEQALAPLRRQLADIIAAVARQHQLAVVLNTDTQACLYLDPDLSIDLQDEVAHWNLR